MKCVISHGLWTRDRRELCVRGKMCGVTLAALFHLGSSGHHASQRWAWGSDLPVAEQLSASGVHPSIHTLVSPRQRAPVLVKVNHAVFKTFLWLIDINVFSP